MSPLHGTPSFSKENAMYADNGIDKLGTYSRPLGSREAFLDSLYFTNDFRECCSFITDLIAELYHDGKKAIPHYKEPKKGPPHTLLSELLNPHSNSGFKDRVMRERLHHHAYMTARYIDGHVPIEKASEMMEAFTAFLEILIEVHDCHAIHIVADKLNAYKAVWQRQGSPRFSAEIFYSHLQKAVDEVISAMEELSHEFLKYEAKLGFANPKLKYSSIENESLHDDVVKVEKVIKKSNRETIKSINERSSDSITIIGPRTEDCKKQVLEVVIYLSNPKVNMSLHDACRKTFTKLKEGYKNDFSLYLWCKRNEAKVRGWVETYRLN